MDNTSDVVSEREDDSGIESTAPDPTDTNLYIRIAVPDLKIQVSSRCCTASLHMLYNIVQLKEIPNKQQMCHVPQVKIILLGSFETSIVSCLSHALSASFYLSQVTVPIPYYTLASYLIRFIMDFHLKGHDEPYNIECVINCLGVTLSCLLN